MRNMNTSNEHTRYSVKLAMLVVIGSVGLQGCAHQPQSVGERRAIRWPEPQDGGSFDRSSGKVRAVFANKPPDGIVPSEQSQICSHDDGKWLCRAVNAGDPVAQCYTRLVYVEGVGQVCLRHPPEAANAAPGSLDITVLGQKGGAADGPPSPVTSVR